MRLSELNAIETLKQSRKVRLIHHYEKVLRRKPFDYKHRDLTYLEWQLDNVWASECYSCKDYALWVADTLVYPHQEYGVEPNAEMPEDVKMDFLEAAAIVNTSARGAAALLRLCIQKIVVHLGEKGGNDLNREIGNLVEKGRISAAIQQALDVVRVVGNNAVHPGVIDFNDNKAVAIQLFGLVNVIVEFDYSDAQARPTSV